MENLCWRDMCQHLKEIQVACGPTESGLPKKQNRITAVRVREAKRASWSRAKPRLLHHSPFEINRCFSKDLLSLSNVLFQISQNGFWQKHQEIGALRWWTRSWIWEPRMVSRYDNVTTKIYIRCPVHWCLNRITHADWWQNLKYKSCMCVPVFFFNMSSVISYLEICILSMPSISTCIHSAPKLRVGNVIFIWWRRKDDELSDWLRSTFEFCRKEKKKATQTSFRLKQHLKQCILHVYPVYFFIQDIQNSKHKFYLNGSKWVRSPLF